MSSRALGLVGITIIGLWHLLQVLSSITFIIPDLLNPDPDIGSFSRSLGPSLLSNALLATILLSLRHRIASALFPDDLNQAPAPDLQPALLSVAGIVIATFAVRALVTIEFDHFYTEQVAQDDMNNPMFQLQPTVHLWTDRVRYGTQLVLGLWVFLGSRGLAGAWKLFRSAGRRR